jgi:pyruvate dehydrogenase E2 component (dihydrolipoamide acetyltransferase)
MVTGGGSSSSGGGGRGAGRDGVGGIALGVRIPLSPIRRQIARVTSESKREIPHYYITCDVDMAGPRRLIASTADPESKLTYTDLAIRAAADAVAAHPLMNAHLEGDEIVIPEHVNVGVVVDTGDGVVVPVIRAAETLTLAEVRAAVRDLGERARQRKLRPTEIRGATFAVSNLGMFGVREFAAVIGPGQCGVLGLGAVADRVVAIEGRPAIVPMMSATLSVDHRIVDGAYAARFLQSFRSALESFTPA